MTSISIVTQAVFGVVMGGSVLVMSGFGLVMGWLLGGYGWLQAGYEWLWVVLGGCLWLLAVIGG